MRKLDVRHGARRAAPLAAFIMAALLLSLLGALTAGAAPLRSPSAREAGTAQYTLDVAWKGDGHVTVEPDKATYDKGELVTLTAVPDSGRRFVAWSGDLEGTDPVATLTMDGDKRVGAQFVLDGYTITVIAGAGGQVSPVPHNPYPSGSSETFTFDPDPGYRVSDVIVDGESLGSLPSYTYPSITHDSTLEVLFDTGPFQITPIQAAGGIISPREVQYVPAGGSCTFAMTAASGYALGDVLVDGDSVGAINPYRFSGVDADHTIQPVFVRAKFSITSWVDGGHGSIDPNGRITYDRGDSRTYVFRPEQGYRVGTVVVDDDPQGSITSYPFNNIDKDHRISVTFVRDQWFTITASAGPNGRITPAGNVQVAPGASAPFSFQPDPFYVVDSVYVDGVRIGNPSSHTIQNVRKDGTIRVTFTPVTYTIAASAGPNGSISPSGNVSVQRNTTKLFTFHPGNGYVVDMFTVDTSRYAARSHYEFPPVTSNHSIKVVFRTVTVTVDLPKSGTWKNGTQCSISWRVAPVAPSGSFLVIAKDTNGTFSQLMKVDATNSNSYTKFYPCKLTAGHRYNIIVCYGNYPSPSMATSAQVAVTN